MFTAPSTVFMLVPVGQPPEPTYFRPSACACVQPRVPRARVHGAVVGDRVQAAALELLAVLGGASSRTCR